jgi:ribosomal protein S18 acetylase RimI-like enzyme
MDLGVQDHCYGIDWESVRNAMIAVGMPQRDAAAIKRAFKRSFAVIFLFHRGTLVGFGRAISDGVYQAALYDVVVIPEYQQKHIGQIIVRLLLKKVACCNTILYATPGKEGFYTKLGFRRMKTAMAHFLFPERMEAVGFI